MQCLQFSEELPMHATEPESRPTHEPSHESHDHDDESGADDYIHIGKASGTCKITILFIKSTSGFDI